MEVMLTNGGCPLRVREYALALQRHPTVSTRPIPGIEGIKIVAANLPFATTALTAAAFIVSAPWLECGRFRLPRRLLPILMLR